MNDRFILFLLSIFISQSLAKFKVLLWSIPPTSPCIYGEPITQEMIDSSFPYEFTERVLNESGFTAGVDFDYVCINNLPSDFFVAPYVVSAIGENYISVSPMAPTSSRVAWGPITKIVESASDIFKGIEWVLFLLIIVVPTVIGGFSYFFEDDLSFIFHISNYLGYLFFQPEIIFNLPRHRYLICLGLQMVNLVFFSLYFWYLERVTDFKKTMGGLSPDDGYYRQKMFVDIYNLELLIGEPFIPIPISHEYITDLYNEDFFIPLFESGDYFPYIGIYSQVGKMEVLMCDYHLVDFPYKYDYYHVSYSASLDREIVRRINPSIVDQSQYYDWAMAIDYKDYSSVEYCPARPSFADFQLSFKDLSLLWAILICGYVLGLVVFLYKFISRKISKSKGRHDFDGLRALKDKEVSRNVQAFFLLYSGISFMTFRLVFTPLFFFFYKKIRERTQQNFKVEKLKEIRGKIIRSIARRKFKFVAFSTFLSLLSLKKKHRGISNENCIKKMKKKKADTRTKGHKYLRSFYTEITKEIFSYNLVSLGIFKSPYNSKLKFQTKGQGLNFRSVTHQNHRLNQSPSAK